MTEKTKKVAKPNVAIILTIILVVAFAFIFVIAFIVSSTSDPDTPATVTADTYREAVEKALEGADPTIGERLAEAHTCTICHVISNGTVAPLFAGISDRAGERRPPLSAEQYIYESIMYPGRFLVPDYADAMPKEYDTLLTQQEIGHIIAYLMTLTEKS